MVVGTNVGRRKSLLDDGPSYILAQHVAASIGLRSGTAVVAGYYYVFPIARWI